MVSAARKYKKIGRFGRGNTIALTLICSLSPLEVSTVSLLSVAEYRYSPTGKLS